MLVFSSKLYFRLFTVLFLALFVFSTNVQVYSQKKRSTTQKAQTSKTKPKKKTKAQLQAEAKKATEAKRKAEAEQKRKAEAAQKRREQQERIRQARARKLAFEKSLRTETFKNINSDDSSMEDSEIRRAAVKALGSRAGTVVVMEAQTGKILTIVNQEWAIRNSFKPCSTIKLVTAIAGLNEDLITSEGNIRSRSFRLDLDDALAYSNNSYFQLVGRNLGSKTMISYAQMLGLGQKTGINAEGEVIGKLPFGNNNARIYSHGDDYEVTPLQLGVMVSTIANGGNLIVPQIPRSNVKKTSFQGFMRRKVNLPLNNLQGVIPGMVGAAEYGTAKRGVDADLRVAGKTGSCIAHGSWVGLFASVAPIDNPQYSVVVITRGQNERGKYAAAVAGQIYQTLSKRFRKKSDRRSAQNLLIFKPKKKVNAATSAKLDTDAGEDSDDADIGKTSEKIIVVKNPSKPKITKKPNKKPAELFPPIIIRKKSNGSTRPRVVKDS
jgi:hypothetical protein